MPHSDLKPLIATDSNPNDNTSGMKALRKPPQLHAGSQLDQVVPSHYRIRHSGLQCFPAQGGTPNIMYWMSVPTDNQTHSTKLWGLYGTAPTIIYCKQSV